MSEIRDPRPAEVAPVAPAEPAGDVRGGRAGVVALSDEELLCRERFAWQHAVVAQDALEAADEALGREGRDSVARVIAVDTRTGSTIPLDDEPRWLRDGDRILRVGGDRDD